MKYLQKYNFKVYKRNRHKTNCHSTTFSQRANIWSQNYPWWFVSSFVSRHLKFLTVSPMDPSIVKESAFISKAS